MSTKSIAEALAHSQAHVDLVVGRFQAMGVDIDDETELGYSYNDGSHKFTASTGQTVEVASPVPHMTAAEPVAPDLTPKRRRKTDA